MKSFQLLRTNPLLTTNLKINVDSGLNIYLSSIKSNADLSNERFNHFLINKDSYLESVIPKFYAGLPKEQAFDVKNDNDNDIVYNDYRYQFDDIYYAGPNYITDTWYQEEFEYFAPLYVKKNQLPDGFIVLRIDEPSVFDEDNGLYDLGILNKDNFRTEIIDKWKSVAYFDMTTNSDLGHWLNRNIDKNERFPTKSFELDVRKVTFSRWYGMDYTTGTYTQKPMFLDNNLFYEQPHFRLESTITDGFQKNSLIYPHILNFNFLFEDTPATPDKLKKYSLNRYCGFYVDDLEFVTNITSYITPPLTTGTTLLNNIVISGATGLTWEVCLKDPTIEINSMNPFVDEWVDGKKYYIYIKDDLYQVVKMEDVENNTFYYKIMSEEVLDSYWDIDRVYDNTVEIVYTGNSYSYIDPIYSGFTVDPYTGCTGESLDMYADLYLIKINDRLHVLRDGSGLTFTNIETNRINGVIDKYFMQSDYAITSDDKKLKYWIGGSNSQYYKEANIENVNRKPLVYSIYRIRFSDIKDFDFDRVTTKYSSYDYEKTKYYETKEDKLHAVDYKSEDYPKQIKKEPVGNQNQDKPIPVSSEYIADDELYETKISGDISDIWKKNQSICKWGYQGSVSHSDYPYKLNNSKKVGSSFNRTTDVFNSNPNIYNKNLDYFYRVGNFLSGLTSDESRPVYYLHQSTNIQTDFINNTDDSGFSQNGGDGFNIGIYFEYGDNFPTNYDFDYFNFFFSNKMYIEDNNRILVDSYKKYSEFYSNEYNQCETLFKGLKVLTNEIDIKRDNGGLITKIVSENQGAYDGYKFAIILNDVYYSENDSTPYNVNGVVNYDGIFDVTNDGIHVIVNDIYENILVIINIGIIIPNNSGETFNYVTLFGEKDGLYDNKYRDGRTASSNYNSRKIVASNFINAINYPNEKYGFDNYIKYHHIRKENGVTVTSGSYINGENNVTNPPLVLTINSPDTIKIKDNSFKVEIVNSPNTSKLFGRDNILNRLNNQKEILTTKLIQDDTITTTKDVYRYSGSYEPIFKNIDLYQKPIFCYTNYTSGTTVTTGLTTNNTTLAEYFELREIDDGVEPDFKNWIDTNTICKSNRTTYAYCNSLRSESLPEYITNYLVCSNFNFNIPLDSIITGVTLTIERKSHIPTVTGSTYVKDHTVQFIANNKYVKYIDTTGYSGVTINSGYTDEYWGTTYSAVTYGHSGLTPEWLDSTTWTSSLINNNKFGVLIRCTIYNYEIGIEPEPPTIDIMPDIKCVTVTVNYLFDNKWEVYSDSIYFKRNLKFDDTLHNFGTIDEEIHSKVNIENKKILKFDDAKYPKVDQFGYSNSNRFVFKSDWDKDFYLNTTENFVDDSTTFTIPSTKTKK